MASIYEKNQLEIGELYLHVKPWRYIIYRPLKLLNRVSKIEGEGLNTKMKYLEDYKIEVLIDRVNKKHKKGKDIKTKLETTELRDTETIEESIKVNENLDSVFENIFDSNRAWT